METFLQMAWNLNKPSAIIFLKLGNLTKRIKTCPQLHFFHQIFVTSFPSIHHSQWRQTDQSISAMALVVFLPRPESIVYRIFMLVHFIPQNSSPRPVGTGDREASLAPLIIQYRYVY